MCIRDRYYLEQRGVKNIKATIDYPLLRKTKEILLEKEDKEIFRATRSRSPSPTI